MESWEKKLRRDPNSGAAVASTYSAREGARERRSCKAINGGSGSYGEKKNGIREWGRESRGRRGVSWPSMAFKELEWREKRMQ
jgi:hypothetical protein